MNTIGSVEVAYNGQHYLVLRDGTIAQERRSTGQQLEDVRYLAAEQFLTSRGLSPAEHTFWTAQHQTTAQRKFKDVESSEQFDKRLGLNVS